MIPAAINGATSPSGWINAFASTVTSPLVNVLPSLYR
jgi:hypothetical protein